MGCTASAHRVHANGQSLHQSDKRLSASHMTASTARNDGQIIHNGLGADQDYILGDLLGKGSFGKVYEAFNRQTHERVAVKVMDRKRIKATSIERELNVLKHLGNHEHVVEFICAYETDEETQFVLEIMDGGELFERLIAKGPYSEDDARRMFAQVADALRFLHRDLKPENLLLKSPDDNSPVKIADFGLSQLLRQGDSLTKVCGTWAYAAPEMSDKRRKGYDFRFDCWSYGVVLYVVLCGFHPFDPDGTLPVPEIKQRARAALYDFPAPEWDGISNSAKDLIRRLIVKDPAERLTSEELCKHPWFADSRVRLSQISPDIDGKLAEYRARIRQKLRVGIAAAVFTSSLRLSGLQVAALREAAQGAQAGLVGTSEDLYDLYSTHSNPRSATQDSYQDDASRLSTDGSTYFVGVSPHQQHRTRCDDSEQARTASSPPAPANLSPSQLVRGIGRGTTSARQQQQQRQLPTILSGSVAHEDMQPVAAQLLRDPS